MNKFIFILILGLSLSAQAQQACSDLFSQKFELTQSELEVIARELVMMRSEMLNSNHTGFASVIRSEYNKKVAELSDSDRRSVYEMMKNVTFDRKAESEVKLTRPSDEVTSILKRATESPVITRAKHLKYREYNEINLDNSGRYLMLSKTNDSGLIKILDLETLKEKKLNLEDIPESIPQLDDNTAGFSKTNKYIFFSSYESGFKVFNLNGELVLDLPAPKNSYYNAKFSKDDNKVALWRNMDNKGIVDIIDLNGGKRVQIKTKILIGSLEFLPNDKGIVVGEKLEPVMATFDMKSTQLARIELDREFQELSYTSDQKLLYVATIPRSSDKEAKSYLLNPVTLKKKDSIKLSNTSRSSFISPDGKMIISNALDKDREQAVQFHSVEAKSLIYEIPGDFDYMRFISDSAFVVHNPQISIDKWEWK